MLIKYFRIFFREKQKKKKKKYNIKKKKKKKFIEKLPNNVLECFDKKNY